MAGEREPEVDTAAMPRIRPLSYEEADAATRRIWDESKGARNPQATELVGISMRNAELHRARSPFVTYVKDSTCLPRRDREIAIMRTAWRCGADFMWAAHTEIGLQCGLTQEDIERVGVGADHPGWTALEAAVIVAIDELHDYSRVSDSTWRTLADTYDDAQMIELVTLAGSYHVMAYLMGAIGIRPPGGTSPDLPGNRFLF